MWLVFCLAVLCLCMCVRARFYCWCVQLFILVYANTCKCFWWSQRTRCDWVRNTFGKYPLFYVLYEWGAGGGFDRQHLCIVAWCIRRRCDWEIAAIHNRPSMIKWWAVELFVSIWIDQSVSDQKRLFRCEKFDGVNQCSNWDNFSPFFSFTGLINVWDEKVGNLLFVGFING